MRKWFGSFGFWIGGLAVAFVALNIDQPYLIALRGAGTAVIFCISVAILLLLLLRARCHGAGIARRGLMLLWCLPPLFLGWAHLSFEARKQGVLRTESAQARILGQHFIVGYTSVPEILPLVQKGLIAGIYIPQHNMAGTGA